MSFPQQIDLGPSPFEKPLLCPTVKIPELLTGEYAHCSSQGHDALQPLSC